MGVRSVRGVCGEGSSLQLIAWLCGKWVYALVGMGGLDPGWRIRDGQILQP